MIYIYVAASKNLLFSKLCQHKIPIPPSSLLPLPPSPTWQSQGAEVTWQTEVQQHSVQPNLRYRTVTNGNQLQPRPQHVRQVVHVH